jgi:hypothetical protein
MIGNAPRGSMDFERRSSRQIKNSMTMTASSNRPPMTNIQNGNA